jgi:hypothetical protein
MTRTAPATVTTSVRIAAPIAPEQVYINLLTPEERRDALVAVGRVKQRSLDETLRQTVIGRLRSGAIQPQRTDPLTGQLYPDIDGSVLHPEGDGKIINVGRMPGYPEYRVFRAPDRGLWVFSPQELDERMAATQAASAGGEQ